VSHHLIALATQRYFRRRGDGMLLKLNHSVILPYNYLMIQFRHTSIVLACLVIALPSSAFGTCCYSATGSPQCCSPIEKPSGCCRGKSQLAGKSCCTSTSNRCDSECKCSTGESHDAIFVPKRENDGFDSSISKPLCSPLPLQRDEREFIFLSACLQAITKGRQCCAFG
jgi:hypothetical protein